MCSSTLRVGTPFLYFISELLYVPEEALENVRTIPLHVVTVCLPNEEPVGNDTDCSTNISGRSVPSQEDVDEHLPSHSCSSLHIDSCLPTNVTVANKVIEREGKEKEEEEKQGEKEENEEEEKEGEKEEKEEEKEEKEEEEEEEEKEEEKEKEEGEVAVEKEEKEGSKKYSNTHVEATCELSPPAKRPRIQQSMCSQPLLPLADDVEGEGFKETSPTGTNVPEDCAHNKEDSGALLLTVLRQCSAWVLDVDLDFFSTSNPFKSLFTEVNLVLVVTYIHR